ncbi:MAG: ethanolamine ammonia-lyase subunit EutC [Planctomycetes bacterium]|nr:ethanolamine ammonia-lyase subunit EutC [Planctomycetota bacterium]
MRTLALMQDLRRRLGEADQRVAQGGANGPQGSLRAAPQLVRPLLPGTPSGAPAGWPRLAAPPQPEDPQRFAQLQAATICQIGVGRAGVRQRTATQLKWLGDRMIAVEAVRSELPQGFEQQIGAALSVQTRAGDLDEFLLRPDLGRELPADALSQVVSRCASGVDVQVLVGDGLSARAVAMNAPPFVQAFRAECQQRGLSLGDVVLVRRARVKVMDQVGEALRARTAVHLVGERPGLGTGDGMSAYLIFEPRNVAMDSDREVLSNIHARGTRPEEAARRVADMLVEFMRVGMSGVKRQAAPDPAERARAQPERRRDRVAERHTPRWGSAGSFAGAAPVGAHRA